MKRFIALIVSMFLVFSVAAAENVNSSIYADTIIQFMEAADLDVDDLQRIVDVAELLIEVKSGVSEPMPQPAGIEGYWILTDAKGENANPDEVAQVKEMIDSGSLGMTLSFAGDTVTGTRQMNGLDETYFGTFVIEGNIITITREGQTTSGAPTEFKVDGDTLELTIDDITVVFTRQ